MDTIKNILKPGREVDNEILYGSGNATGSIQTGNTGLLSGEGSHLPGATETGPASGQGNHFSNSNETSNITTGTLNPSQETGIVGPHSSILASKADPLVDSDVDGSKTVGHTNTGYGMKGASTMPGEFPSETETHNQYSSAAMDTRLNDTSNISAPDELPSQTTTTGPNRMGHDDAALAGAAVVGGGVHDGSVDNSGYTGMTASGANTSYDAQTSSAISSPRDAAAAKPSGGINQDDPDIRSRTEADAEVHDDKTHVYGSDSVEVGAAGLGTHELSKRHEEKEIEREQALDLTSGSAYAPATTTSQVGSGGDPILTGPVHRSSLLNKLDPRVKKISPETNEDITSTRTETPSASHIERDAAGVGAAGLGAHELSQHHKAQELEGKQAQGPGLGQTTEIHDHGERHAITAAPISITADNGAEERLKGPNPYESSQVGHDSTNSHFGRDATTVGAMGLGGHELKEHHDSKKLNKEEPYGVSETTAVALGGPNEHENLSSEPRGHKSRNMTTAGVIGAGAYEAEQHHSQNKDEKAFVKEQKREAKEEWKEEKREAREESKEEKWEAKEEKKQSSGGLLGFLRRDKNKNYSKEEEKEFDRQEREHNSHSGRDVAIGAGAAGLGAHELKKNHKDKELEEQAHATASGHTTCIVDNSGQREGVEAGGVGAGKHEIQQHHGHDHFESNINKPLPVAPGNNGVGTGEGTVNIMNRKRGIGYESHDDPLGDHLHGKARNHGVDESTGNIRGTNEPAPEGLILGNHDPHNGRDAAFGAEAGGIGAATYEHEHKKHAASGMEQGISSPTGENYTTSNENTGYENTTSSYGTSQVPRGSVLDTGVTNHGLSSSHGPNKLHKDPPAHHPAAQGGMTEDGRYIQPGTGRQMLSGTALEDGSRYPSDIIGSTGTHIPAGETQRDLTVGDGIQGDSGVANPHTDNNLSQKY